MGIVLYLAEVGSLLFLRFFPSSAALDTSSKDNVHEPLINPL